MTKRREKKSESLEIRLPYSQKQAFMEACRERGVTASDVLREFISDDLRQTARASTKETWAMTFKHNPLKTAAGGISAALAAATFGTGISLAEDTTFERFDANGDGFVSYSEFVRLVSPEGGDIAQDTIVGGADGADQVETIIEHDGRTIERRVIRRSAEDSSVPLPPTPEMPGRGARELFQGLDRNGSGTLSENEFEGQGRLVRRSDDVVELNGAPSRLLGLEVMTFDITESGNVSISINALTTAVDADADPANVAEAFGKLEGELRQLQSTAVPVMPAPPVPGE